MGHTQNMGVAVTRAPLVKIFIDNHFTLPTSNDYIISFEGKKSDDPADPDFVPSIFSFSNVSARVSHQKLARLARIQQRRELSKVAYIDLAPRCSSKDIEEIYENALDTPGRCR